MEKFKEIYESIKNTLPYRKNIKELTYSDLVKSLVPQSYFEEENFLIGGKFLDDSEDDTKDIENNCDNNTKTKIKKEFCISKTGTFLIIEGKSKYIIDKETDKEIMISLVRNVKQEININELKDLFDISEEELINLLFNAINNESFKLNENIIIRKNQIEKLNKEADILKNMIDTIKKQIIN